MHQKHSKNEQDTAASTVKSFGPIRYYGRNHIITLGEILLSNWIMQTKNKQDDQIQALTNTLFIA